MRGLLYISILIGVLVSGLPEQCQAAQPYTPVFSDPVAEQWRWRTYPELKGQGLSCLAQDQAGNLWFGTDEGVHRYDGLEWTVFKAEEGLAGSQVNTICASRSVFVGTEKGINRFQDGKWHRVFPSQNDITWTIWDIEETNDGGLWAGTEWGVIRWTSEGSVFYTAPEDTAGIRASLPNERLAFAPVPDHALLERPWPAGIGAVITSGMIFKLAPGGPAELAGLKIGDRVFVEDESEEYAVLKVQHQQEPERVLRIEKQLVKGTYRECLIYDVCEGASGEMWFGAIRGYLLRLTVDGIWQVYDRNNGIDQGMMPRICRTQESSIWAVYADNSKSVNRFDGQKWEAIEVGNLGRGHHYTSIIESRDGTLWIGGSRLIAFRDDQWQVYNPEELPTLPSHRTELIETADGALWVAGRGQEVARLDRGYTHWKTFDGLIFQCETQSGVLWFVSQDNKIVRFDGRDYMQFGHDDGLMDTPSRVMVTGEGTVWAAGSHEQTAATARFYGSKWETTLHPSLAWTIDPRAVYEAKDGTTWFGACVDWWFYPEKGFQGGVLAFDGTVWKQHTPIQIPYTYGIGQTRDGIIHFGGRLATFDGQKVIRFNGPDELNRDFIDVVYTAPAGDLWLGSRTYGAFRHDGTTWQRYDYRHGMPDNRVRAILQDRDGSIWVSTSEGISRFDGQTWIPHALPETLPGVEFSGSIGQSQDGALWLNAISGATAWLRRAEPRRKTEPYALKTIRYVPEKDPPETKVTISQNEVQQNGNITLGWEGVDLWAATRNEDLKFAWRLDNGQWSHFSSGKIQTFEHLPVGAHTFEVKARDLAFNEDPTPVVIRFSVLPPVWKRTWFMAMVTAFVGLTGYQASRIVVRDRRLQKANTALRNEMAERERLDSQIQNLRYLYRLRTELELEKSPDGVIRRAGETLISVLEGTAGAKVTVVFDGREWGFGEDETKDARQYTRPIIWAGKTRGHLTLNCSMALTESQERALLDETAGQLARALEARELEMQLLQSARLVSLGQMAAGVAHELNQPLTVIETTAGDICLRLIEDLPIPTEELRAMMENVREVVERMAGTIDHLRVFSRDVSEDPRRELCLNEVVLSSLKMIGKQLENHGIDLKFDLAEDLPKIWGHPHPLEQVFLNLLANARDAVDEGGKEKQICIRTSRENGHVLAEVIDSGIGMDQVTQQRLFEPFFTTKEADRGTGLGLSIVYAIVRNHDGNISCVSEPGAGATFRVVLPAVEG